LLALLKCINESKLYQPTSGTFPVVSRNLDRKLFGTPFLEKPEKWTIPHGELDHMSFSDKSICQMPGLMARPNRPPLVWRMGVTALL
jgi:hypothetical protein